MRSALRQMPRRLRRASLALVASLLAFGGLGLATPHAAACDRCNARFLEALLDERSDSLLARDALTTMRNQRAQPFHRHTEAPLVRAVEELPDSVFGGGVGVTPASRATANAAAAPLTGTTPTGGAAPTEGGDEVAPAPPSRLPALTGPRRPFAADGTPPPAFAGADFIEVLARDEGLHVRPTSTVSQDVTPDRVFDIRLHEGQVYLGQGVVYDGFLTNGSIPGPTLIMEEGEIIRMNIINDGNVPHGASIHAAYTQTSKYVGNIAPGETKGVTFRASQPGVYMYHCAPGGHAIPMHVIAGQYGMMVVRPKQAYALEEELGRGPDVEIFLLQNEIYASGHDAIRGDVAYTTFNGRLFRYVEEPIVANPGDYVRINYLNVGPNLVSTFHLVGIVWDYVYWQGLPENRLVGGQTVTAGPSDSWVIEFRAPADEGAYLMLNHAVGPTARGAIGVLSVSAEGERSAQVLADGETRTEEEMAEIRAKAIRVVAPFGIGSPDVDRPVRYGPEVDEVTVTILGNSYHPKIIEIEPGTTVRWVNEETFTYMQGEFSGIHNAVGIKGPELFSIPMLAHAESGSHTFTEPGEYEYLCTPHPYMRGRIVVRAPATAAEPPSGGCAAAGGGATPLALALLLGAAALVARRRRGGQV